MLLIKSIFGIFSINISIKCFYTIIFMSFSLIKFIKQSILFFNKIFIIILSNSTMFSINNFIHVKTFLHCFYFSKFIFPFFNISTSIKHFSFSKCTIHLFKYSLNFIIINIKWVTNPKINSIQISKCFSKFKNIFSNKWVSRIFLKININNIIKSSNKLFICFNSINIMYYTLNGSLSFHIFSR